MELIAPYRKASEDPYPKLSALLSRIRYRIDTVFAMEAATPRRDLRHDDGAVVAFRTDHGAVGSVVVSQASPGRKNQLSFSFDGRETAVQFNQERPDELILALVRR